MKNYYLIIATLLFFSCSVTKSSSDYPVLDGPKWVLTNMEGKVSTLGDKVFLKFDDKEDQASGRAACNTFSGSYVAVRNTLLFEEIASTKMYCEGVMDTENKFLANLGRVKRYEVKSDMLHLYSSDGLLMIFKKTQE